MVKRADTVPSAPLKAFMEENQMDFNQASVALRVSDGTIRSWIKTEKMPGYVLVCIEGARRRSKAPNIWLVKVPDDKAEAVRSFLGALRLEFGEMAIK